MRLLPRLFKKNTPAPTSKAGAYLAKLSDAAHLASLRTKTTEELKLILGTLDSDSNPDMKALLQSKNRPAMVRTRLYMAGAAGVAGLGLFVDLGYIPQFMATFPFFLTIFSSMVGLLYASSRALDKADETRSIIKNVRDEINSILTQRRVLASELEAKVAEISRLVGPKAAHDFAIAFKKQHGMTEPLRLESGIKGYLEYKK